MIADANRAALARVIAFYDALSATDLDRLGDIYASSAYFRDPFNEVRGLPAIRDILARMFANLVEPRFRILQVIGDDKGALLVWDMTFRFRQWKRDAVQTIHGASHVKFDSGGKLIYHRDYWDTGEELYAKLPLIGPVVRFLRRKFR